MLIFDIFSDKHPNSHLVPNYLRIPGDIPVLRAARGGGPGNSHHSHGNSRLFPFHLLEEKTAVVPQSSQ